MPTQQKIAQVEEIKGWIEGSTIAISTDYTGMSVTAMTELRKALRESGVRYHIVKNTLAHLAAEASGKPAIKEIIEGPTGLAFGYEDPTEPAKALADFIRTSRLSLKIRGGVMEDRKLTDKEVNALATMPSRDQLIAQLLGQMQGPISGLVYVLNGPVAGLARVLQGRIDQLEQETQ